HAYGITDLRRIRVSWWRRFFKHPPDTLLVRLHNPWGEGEWNGPWADDSKEWRAVPNARKKQLGVKIADDGDFWMSFPDFCTNFTSLIICRHIPTNNNHLRLFQRHRWRSAVFLARWSLADNTAGGCVNYPQTFPKNHQYIFTIHDPAVCVISLMQQDSRRKRHLGAENATIGFVILRVERNRRYRFHKSMYEVIAKVTYMNSREVSGRFKLLPGRYVCVPTTFDPSEEGDFFLRMFFSCRRFVHVKELKTDGPTPPLWWRIPRSVFLQDSERRNLYFYDGFVKISIVSAELNPPRGKRVVTVPVSTSTSTTFSPDQNSTDGTSQTQSTVPVFVNDFECYALLAFMDLKTKRWVRSFETTVVGDTLNPVFNQDFLHYVRDPRRIGVVVQLWQRGPLGQDRFMGEIRIALDKYTDERKQGKTWEVQRTLTKLRGFPNLPNASGGPDAAQTAWRGWETVKYSSRNAETNAMLSSSRRDSSAHDSRSNLTRSAPHLQHQAPRLIDSAVEQVTRANATGGLTRSPPPQPPILQVITPELQVESIAERVTRSNNETMAGKTLNPLLLPPPSIESGISQVTRSSYIDENRLQAGSVRSRVSRASSRTSGVRDSIAAAPAEQPAVPSSERKGPASTRKRKETGAGELKIRITYVRDRGQGLIEE
ncbi:calpain large subunit, domain III-domain-containing protein, partial [Endogone sp. FLAS-F59071]